MQFLVALLIGFVVLLLFMMVFLIRRRSGDELVRVHHCSNPQHHPQPGCQQCQSQPLMDKMPSKDG